MDSLINEIVWDMEENKSKLPVIIQPNAITSARYEYTQIQKDFMYHFIEKMNKHMTKERMEPQDLFGFGRLEVEMELKEMVKSYNYDDMLDAIKDLQKKPIQFNYQREDGEYEVSTHLVATLYHKKGSGKIRIATTEASLPVITYIGAGFTAYNKIIALSLPSIYAKRMYELCCRWKDKGFCRITIKEFRKMMMIEDKFKKHSDLVRNVLEISEKILTEQAELTFKHTFRKENKSKGFNWLELTIVQVRAEGENADNKSVWYPIVYNILYSVYYDVRAMKVCDQMAEKDNLKKAAERFKRLKKDIDKGKIEPHGIVAYVNKVLTDEYEVPEGMLITKEKKEKKKKAEKKIAQLKAYKVAAEKAVKEKEEKAKDGLNAIKAVIKKGKKDAEERSGQPQSIKDIFHQVIE